MRNTNYNYDYYDDHLHYKRTDTVTISTNTAYRSIWIRSSILTTNSDLIGWPSRMSWNTLSAEAKLYLHPAVQQSIELCTSGYQKAKFHISRQTMTRSATEHDLMWPRISVHPRTSVHPPKFVPYAPGVCIDAACLGRAFEINGFMP